MDYAADPNDVSTLLHLGLAHFHSLRFDSARFYLQRLLSLTSVPADHLRQVYGVLASMHMREGKPEDALRALQRGLEMFPRAEYLLYLKGECLYELDRYAEAQTALLAILRDPPETKYRGSVPAEIRDRMAPRKLADIYRLERKFGQAEHLLTRILDRLPTDTLSWHALGRVFIDSEDRPKLMGVIDRLKSCPQGEVFSDLLLAYWYLRAREFHLAGQAIDRLIVQAPQMPMPRILRIELLNQMGATSDEQLQASRDLLRVQPGNREAQALVAHLQATRPTQQPLEPACTSVVLGPAMAVNIA